MSEIYILRKPDTEWGDYGDILISGISSYRESFNNVLELQRTGPFVPPISFPGIGDIVVTDSFKSQLEGSGLTGLSFRDVVKKRIVHSDWDTWDRGSEPRQYPESGEPEDYIFVEQHSEAISKQIGHLWELNLEQIGAVEKRQIGAYPWDIEVILLVSSWDGRDFFRSQEVLHNFVSRLAKEWLESNIPDWVSFQQVKTA